MTKAPILPLVRLLFRLRYVITDLRSSKFVSMGLCRQHGLARTFRHALRSAAGERMRFAARRKVVQSRNSQAH